jgi:RNA polymerase sigma-70 factor (sigma-E family)
MVAGEGWALMPTSVSADRDAVLSELYAHRYRALVRLAALLLPDVESCEDIVQEAFVRVYAAWPRIRDAEKADAYVRQAIVNLARSRLRRLAVAARHLPKPDPDGASAEELAYQQFERDAVVQALRTLSRRQREALALRYYADMTLEQVASAMGVSVGSVKGYLSRGLDALEQQLGGAL